jgi:D-3-phosphoglycerate dehydrogenase
VIEGAVSPIEAPETARYTVVVTDDPFDDFEVERSVLEPEGCNLVVNGDDRFKHIESADGLMVSRAVVDDDVLARAPKLRVIARYGIGVENIDVDAAERRGITVVNTPDYCTHEVAEHVIAQVLACSRQLVRLDRVVRRGSWSPSNISPLHRLDQSVLGLVGFGRIGRAVALRAKSLGLTVVASDPYLDSSDVGVELIELGDLLKTADFVSLHLPLTRETERMIGRAELAQMKDTAYLINAARGGLVDEEALADALRNGRIAGAALDVLTTEPVPLTSPLLELDNVILTPHVAFYSIESLRLRKRMAAEGVRDVLTGRKPQSVVPPRTGRGDA